VARGGLEPYGALVLRLVLGVIYIAHAYLALVMIGPRCNKASVAFWATDAHRLATRIFAQSAKLAHLKPDWSCRSA